MSALGKSYNRIAVIKEFPHLDRAFSVWWKLQRVTHDSWPAFFKTQEHKRRVLRADKVARLFNKRVEKRFGIAGQAWRVKRVPTVGYAILWHENEEA